MRPRFFPEETVFRFDGDVRFVPPFVFVFAFPFVLAFVLGFVFTFPFVFPFRDPFAAAFRFFFFGGVRIVPRHFGEPQ